MFNFFKRKTNTPPPLITTDIHSHLIPGVDDGVTSFEDAITLIKKFADAGYEKIITTPHIMHDFYNNSESDLTHIYNNLVLRIKKENIEINFGLAAEYYLDDHLMSRINDKNENFLTFGDNYILFETSFMNMPFQLSEFIFKAKSRGLKPVLAHPERYMYLMNDEKLLTELVNKEVLFQLNLNSLTGYYSKQVKKFAQKLIDEKLIHFAGSDCHNELHFNNLLSSRESKYYSKLADLPLLNYSI